MTIPSRGEHRQPADMDDHLVMDETGDERYLLGLIAGCCNETPRVADRPYGAIAGSP